MIRVLADSTLSGGNVEMADGKRLPPRLSAAREGEFLYVEEVWGVLPGKHKGQMRPFPGICT